VTAEIHPPVEEYLEAIHELEEEGIHVIQARLAERLGHSAPSVSEMIHRLQDEGHVRIDGRDVTLTTSGRKRAESVVRKHRLAERLLTDVIGLEWHKAHAEACRWEHVISDEVEAHLVKLLGNPTTCPHGNPIPGSGGGRPALSSLADATPGDRVQLERVTEQIEIDAEASEYLSTHGFVPGARGAVVSRSDDGTLTVELDSGTVELGPKLARQLYVAAS
jgi:DtxR family transcriptional regulator, Mn-dependent transcriptional regulator